MKCPLFTIGGYDNSHLPRFGWNDCLEEECAWWDEVEKRCLIYFIERDLAGIHTALVSMLNKMPHAGQFTK